LTLINPSIKGGEFIEQTQKRLIRGFTLFASPLVRVEKSTEV
jgi:hypothetical protein